MHNPINDFFINKLYKCQCGFRKWFGAQHCFLVMIRKLQKIQDSKRVFEAVFLDLSKAFDCISHESLIAKLSAYGFDIKSLNFILAYFTSQKQKAKIGFSFINFLNILFGLPQGYSHLFLLIIYICSLFMEYGATEFI